MKLEEFLRALRAHFGLTEAVNVSDSMEALRSELESALNQWLGRPSDQMEVMWTFADRIIAYHWSGGRDTQAWEIPYTRNDDGFVFGEPVKVERVVRFEAPMGESLQSGERITEQVEQRLTLLSESTGGGRRVKAIGITADVVNENRRRYPRKVLALALAELNNHLHESAGQGRMILTGEAEHPSTRGGRANILETVVKWEAAALNASGQVILEGVILPTAKGKDVQVLIENGVRVGVSQRAYGLSKTVEENGQSIEEVTQLKITGYDLVAEPSDPNGAIIESREPETPAKENKPMNLDELLKLLKEQPEMAEALMGRLGLADKKSLAESLGVDPARLEDALKAGKSALDELAERKRQEAIAAAITEATKDLAYGDDMNALFVEAVRAASPETPEAVKTLVEAKRKEYDAIAAKAKLESMGKKDEQKPKGPTIERVTSNFEEQTGHPEFARPAYELAEGIRLGTMMPRRDLLRNPKTVNEEFAARYLKLFDEQYKRFLIMEAKEFAEAEQTSDLNIPYSVSRAIMAEAFPMLVATSIFDVDTTDQAPTRLYFETTTGESGFSGTVTDEAVTGDHGVWVALANKRLTPGTVVLTNSGATVTYTEGTDYVIDYANGQIMTLAAGATTDAQALLIDYGYTAIRKGELQPIERAKTSLTYKVLDIAADRLATEISREAVVFSRSQLGWDATTRTLTNLVREVRRKIDQGLIYMGLAAALQVANNSGGTWTASTDPIGEFVEKTGVARVKVANRYYDPTFLLLSTTNSDKVANWDGFTAAGKRPDSDLNANGFIGRLKGLATFESTEMSDGYGLVGNRELVQHRIFQAMQLRGPFPSYSSNKLLASEQYYAEEFNGSDAPVPEKGSTVKIA